MSDYRLLIDGKLVSGVMALNVVNPATEEVVAVAPRADRAQLEQAVAAAKAAFPRWLATPVRDRGVLLARLADAVEVRQAEFAELLTAENGKPIAQAVHEMAAVAAAIPAVVIYNSFSRQITSYRAALADASASVLRFVSRDLDRGLALRKSAAE